MGKTRRLPPNDLGDAASATFGGRFDAALVGVALPAVLVDISKTYASLFALLGLDGVYGCREFRSEPRDPTLIASLLTDPAAIWQAETWAELGLTFVTLHPTGQPLPCSVELAPGRWRSMVAPLDLSGGSATYHWAEVLAAVVAGADPASIQIDRVFSIRPVGTQPDLTPVRLVTGRTVDLTSGELGAALVTEATRSDLPRWQRNLARATAQAISYGVLLRHDPIPRSGETSAVGPGGHRVTVRAARPERPGPFTFLPAGAAVCAATRLIIALLTAELRAAGSAAMAIHADSVTIPCTPTGESFPVDGASDGRLRTLTPGQLDQLLDGFAPLGITFRTEVANPDGRTHGLVVGVNKTVFAQHRADRSWQVVRSSDTGLGGSLADPSDTPGTRTPDGRWQWSATLETTMFPRDEPAPLPGWVDRPVVRRYTANTPAVLAQLRDELADPTVMPFARYLRAEPLVGTGGPVALGPWPDPARWAEAGWRLHGKPVTDPAGSCRAHPAGLAYTLTRTVSDYFTAWATPNDPSTTGPERGLRDPVPIRSALGLTVVVGRDSADLPDTEPDPAMPNPTSRLVYGHTAQAELRNRIRDIGPRRFSQQSGIAWSTVSQYVNDRPGSPQLTQRIAIALARYTPTPRATRLVPCGHCNKPPAAEGGARTGAGWPRPEPVPRDPIPPIPGATGVRGAPAQQLLDPARHHDPGRAPRCVAGRRDGRPGALRLGRQRRLAARLARPARHIDRAGRVRRDRRHDRDRMPQRDHRRDHRRPSGRRLRQAARARRARRIRARPRRSARPSPGGVAGIRAPVRPDSLHATGLFAGGAVKRPGRRLPATAARDPGRTVTPPGILAAFAPLAEAAPGRVLDRGARTAKGRHPQRCHRTTGTE